MDGILPPDGTTHELVECPTLERHQLLTDLGTQPLAEQGCLLCIRVDVVCTILCKVYEPLVVLVHHVRTLLKVQGLLLLVVLEAIRDVVLAEGLMELSPQHLMAVRKGSGEGHQPGTCRPTELLGYEQRLLHLRVAEKTKFSLGCAKPAVGHRQVCGLSEHMWVCRQEVRVGSLMLLVLTWLLLLLMGLTALVIRHQPLHESILSG
jgi:hypothetical protein